MTTVLCLREPQVGLGLVRG